MTKLSKNYNPTSSNFWNGRVDDPADKDSFRMHQIINCFDLNKVDKEEFNPSKLNICLLGFCSDEGVKRNLGRKGAAKGPDSIRKEFANLPVTFGDKVVIYDVGNIFCLNDNLEEAQIQLATAVQIILGNNLFPIILGGGHELVFGHYEGIINHFTTDNSINQTLGIINFDAHFDLRPYNKSGSSGTMFSQIADNCMQNNRAFKYMCLGIQTYANTISLFKKADALEVKYILAKDLTEKNTIENLLQIKDFIDNADKIYTTICSDVFNSAHAPGVSSIQPFGMDPEIILRYLKEIIKSKKLISIDIAEVSPRFDFDNRTAKLAAVIIYAIINTLIENIY